MNIWHTKNEINKKNITIIKFLELNFSWEMYNKYILSKIYSNNKIYIYI